MSEMLIKNAQVFEAESSDVYDIYIADGYIKSAELAGTKYRELGLESELAIGSGLESEPGSIIDAEGAGLIPGLHDHHIHLLALAEVANSIDLAKVRTRQELAVALQTKTDSVRGIGYHEHIAGKLNRQILDDLSPDKPVRIQHRTGALWILNSPALKELGISSEDGCILRGDKNLILSLKKPEELGQVFKRLNEYGVTGATDATPGYSQPEVDLFQEALKKDANCALTLMLENNVSVNGVFVGPRKILLDDFNLPDFSDLAELITTTHKQSRSVAIHSVTRSSLALCVAVFNEVGVLDGDRIEHASVAPLELVAALSELGIRIVTQPNFIFERGDTYLLDVDKEDQEHLYRCQGWLDAGVALAGGTDAPFGSENPWVAIWAAMNRKTQKGEVINAQEKLGFIDALKLFLSVSTDPGGEARKIKAGEVANLCLLNAPLGKVAETQPVNPVARCIYEGKEV